MDKSQLKELADEIREINIANGWKVWQPGDFKNEPYKFGTVVALIHSEQSEALEWYRQMGKTGHILHDKILTAKAIKKLMDPKGVYGEEGFCDEYPKIESNEDILNKIKEEMADTIIRVLDWWSAYDDDPLETIKAKLAKNRTRGYRHDGKLV